MSERRFADRPPRLIRLRRVLDRWFLAVVLSLVALAALGAALAYGSVVDVNATTDGVVVGDGITSTGEDRSDSPVRTYGSITLVAAALCTLGLLAIGRYRGVIAPNDRERSIHRQAGERAAFDQWVSRGRVPEQSLRTPAIEIASLAELVDVAVDSGRRVVEDIERDVYFVVDGDQVYFYNPNEVPETTALTGSTEGIGAIDESTEVFGREFADLLMGGSPDKGEMILPESDDPGDTVDFVDAGDDVIIVEAEPVDADQAIDAADPERVNDSDDVDLVTDAADPERGNDLDDVDLDRLAAALDFGDLEDLDGGAVDADDPADVGLAGSAPQADVSAAESGSGASDEGSDAFASAGTSGPAGSAASSESVDSAFAALEAALDVGAVDSGADPGDSVGRPTAATIQGKGGSWTGEEGRSTGRTEDDTVDVADVSAVDDLLHDGIVLTRDDGFERVLEQATTAGDSGDPVRADSSDD